MRINISLGENLIGELNSVQADHPKAIWA